ncbi:MAG: rab-GTPase-TBC domain-containing protein [Olpidium bornovanus]|uniref:Rab-GTPase-TBC domain-containing protein n=1 Tax=Olpidium bornovanus TaxID=278681 RepID=A0A8H7ZN51_9FUNG|nr:MAG: rab-GTPase-TBC domain-containing protein [Olpidium bornovanus]
MAPVCEGPRQKIPLKLTRRRCARGSEQRRSPAAALRKLGWGGIPDEFRPMTWQLLLGYLPCNADRRLQTLARKRKEYEESVNQNYAKGQAGLDQALWHQIHIDVPRTNPDLWGSPPEARSAQLQTCRFRWRAFLEMTSSVWKGCCTAGQYGIRLQATFKASMICARRSFKYFYLHTLVRVVESRTASMTDLRDCGTVEIAVSSFFFFWPLRFFLPWVRQPPARLPKSTLTTVEADTFWCLTKLLDSIQDNYTFSQPGIQRQVAKLKELVARIDAPLSAHLQAQEVEFIQFAFRWMNCLLMRELSLKLTIRMPPS